MGLSRNNRKGKLLIAVRLAFLSALFILIGGCTVKYSFSGASISPEVKTFSVAYFQNRAPLVQVGLSQYITDALIDKCKSQTNLNVSFEGDITDYKTVPLTVAADALAAMNRFTITVKVKFINSINPDLSFDQTFSRYADYSASLNLTDVEKELSDEIVSQLVEDIFNQAFVNW